ncbi:hypothetical protein BJ322DRAFT_1102599 [Thelephora terrestris]|uniref:Uncharacterized protein n=1 Tax=Thelephora terrestris TaxID=56493 RepID=A0A9P6HSF8_9AGAM|nr:hypothetical protein BJ322DRAFT_1102599 [Thelephora terrestris]
MLTTKTEKTVNELLHRARGERFRHDQNVRKDKARHHASVPTKSLPPYLLAQFDSDDHRTPRLSNEARSAAGPVPKSWRTVKKTQDKESPEWRGAALSLVLDGVPVNRTPVPPLSELCMRVLLDAFSEPEDFEQELLPFLPPRLRHILQRYTAIHAPLSTPGLSALVGESGHINGELIVVGPGASLRPETIALKPPDRQTPVDDSQDWEADDPFVDLFELRTLALVSTDLALQTLLSFPRSLTRLALVDISTPPPIFRLPTLCPSITVLDLSFNSWLEDLDRSHAILGIVDWDKWDDLHVLGLRGCIVHQVTLDLVNQNRWVEVQILLA